MHFICHDPLWADIYQIKLPHHLLSMPGYILNINSQLKYQENKDFQKWERWKIGGATCKERTVHPRQDAGQSNLCMATWDTGLLTALRRYKLEISYGKTATLKFTNVNK